MQSRTVIIAVIAALLFCGGYYLGCRGPDGRAAELEQYSQQLGEELDAAQSTIGSLRAEHQRLTERYIDLEVRHQNLAAEIPGYLDRIAELETGLTGVGGEISTVREGLREDRQRLRELESAINAAIERAEESPD